MLIKSNTSSLTQSQVLCIDEAPDWAGGLHPRGLTARPILASAMHVSYNNQTLTKSSSEQFAFRLNARCSSPTRTKLKPCFV